MCHEAPSGVAARLAARDCAQACVSRYEQNTPPNTSGCDQDTPDGGKPRRLHPQRMWRPQPMYTQLCWPPRPPEQLTACGCAPAAAKGELHVGGPEQTHGSAKQTARHPPWCPTHPHTPWCPAGANGCLCTTQAAPLRITAALNPAVTGWLVPRAARLQPGWGRCPHHCLARVQSSRTAAASKRCAAVGSCC